MYKVYLMCARRFDSEHTTIAAAVIAARATGADCMILGKDGALCASYVAHYGARLANVTYYGA